MDFLLYKYGNNFRDVFNVLRVKLEGEEMVNLDKGGCMFRLMYEGSKVWWFLCLLFWVMIKEVKNIMKKSWGIM